MNNPRKRFSYTMHLNASPEKVFPLLCPVREYDWIEHWKCEVLYSETGFAEKDCIFKTNFPDEGEDIWVTSEYIPSRLIEFVRVNSCRTIRYQISVEPYGNGKSKSEWIQVITALNERGTLQLNEMSESEFTEEKKALESMLNYFLKTGKMLKK